MFSYLILLMFFSNYWHLSIYYESFSYFLCMSQSYKRKFFNVIHLNHFQLLFIFIHNLLIQNIEINHFDIILHDYYVYHPFSKLLWETITSQVTFSEPEAATRACADPSPVIDGRRTNCNIASLGIKRSWPTTSQLGNYTVTYVEKCSTHSTSK